MFSVTHVALYRLDNLKLTSLWSHDDDELWFVWTLVDFVMI